MKKIGWFAYLLVILFFFESCNKEKLTPNYSKKAATSQEQSVQESPAPEPPSSACPHAPSNCPNAPGNTAG
jgi:hypothetical protein